MKSLAIALLTASAFALLALNWQIRQANSSTAPTAIDESVLAHPSAPVAPEKTEAATVSPSQPARTNSQGSAPEKPNRPAFNWAAIEVADYKEYVKRLRAVGFPEELVRDILIADLGKFFEAREQALKPKPVAYDAPLSQRQNHDIGSEDWQRIKGLRDLRVEEQTALESILGAYVPREILRTPISRNYEAYEFAISQLPPEKRDAAQWAQQTEIYVEGYNKTTSTHHAAELEAYKHSRDQRDEELRQVLTPEAFERYEMNTHPAGTELARRTIGMQPTDEEFRTMFQIAYKNWVDTDGVYGRWRAIPVPSEQIAAADREMNDSLKDALGHERFLDYQMTITQTGQQMPH